MNLQYTTHAREQMIVRGVTAAEVEAVIVGYDVHYPDPKGNSCYVRYLGGRWLRIVVAAGSWPLRIVTVIVIG